MVGSGLLNADLLIVMGLFLVTVYLLALRMISSSFEAP